MDTFEVQLDHDQCLVRVTATGDLYQADGEKIITTARSTAAQYGFNILYDVREAALKMSLARWFHLPRTLGVLKEAKTRHVKAAILISANTDTEAYQFYELVAANVGLKVRTCFTEEEAVAWLMDKPDG